MISSFTVNQQDEEGTFNANRVTALLPYEDTIWVGTGSGQILVFEIRGGNASEIGKCQLLSIPDFRF